MAPRFSTPKDKYDPQDEAAFRRMVLDALTNEFPEIRIGGGVLYGEAGNLKFRSRNGTVTIVAPL
jgi:hypothetical protein